MRYCLCSLMMGLMIISCGRSVGRADQEQWLPYRYHRQAEEMVSAIRIQRLDLIHAVPEGPEFPDFVGDQPILAKWNTPMVEQGFLWLALDQSQAQGRYDRLYVDSDGDGHLNDETVTKANREGKRSTYFGPVKVLFASDNGLITYHLNLRFYQRDERQRLYMSPGGWYEGKIRIGDKQHYCQLVDHNGNGVFNDRALDERLADRMSLAKPDISKFQSVGSYMQIQQALYELQIAPDGAFVAFRPAAQVQWGEVKVPSTISQLAVGGPMGGFDLTCQDGLVKLPVGKYRLQYWTIERKDDQGAPWKVKGKDFGEQGLFTVQPDQPTELTIGEPLKANLKVTKDQTQYHFDQTLKGRLGESIEMTKEGGRPPVLLLRVKNKTGTYNKTLSFEYG